MLDNREENAVRLYDECHEIFKGGCSYDLHMALRPFYEKYMRADVEFYSRAHTSSRMEVHDLMGVDPHFGYWLAERDLVKIVQEWGCTAQDSVSMHMLHVVRCALQGGYENDWKTLADTFHQQLLEEAEYGTPWSREACAVMHAVSVIYSTPLDE